MDARIKSGHDKCVLWGVVKGHITSIFKNSQQRHCEPPGRANARPMTGSAKQSIIPLRGKMDCFASLAMTVWLFEI